MRFADPFRPCGPCAALLAASEEMERASVLFEAAAVGEKAAALAAFRDALVEYRVAQKECWEERMRSRR